MQGYAPAVAIEMARKTIPSSERPSFYDLEAALGK
jgi:flagellar motor component MotA